MWITIRPFHYRGRNFKAGDQVPAEKWPARRMFVSRKRIEWVEEPEGAPAQKSISKMNRAELNEYATNIGILDAAEYPNRDALLEKIDEVDEREVDVETSPVDGLESELEDDELEPETVEEEDESAEEEDDTEEIPTVDDSDDEDTEDPNLETPTVE